MFRALCSAALVLLSSALLTSAYLEDQEIKEISGFELCCIPAHVDANIQLPASPCDTPCLTIATCNGTECAGLNPGECVDGKKEEYCTFPSGTTKYYGRLAKCSVSDCIYAIHWTPDGPIFSIGQECNWEWTGVQCGEWLEQCSGSPCS
ncbi:MAG: hypothetical protein AAF682_11475 [Planctomycetota bacterium]